MSARGLFRVVIVLVLGSLLAACATNASLRNSYAISATGPYLLDTGDVLRVTVFGEADLSNTYQVDDRGCISFPLTGPVEVRGATTQIAASRVAAALANGYLRNPNVAIEVANYRPFYIQGDVAAPGQFPFVYGMTVRAAISTAGGFTETANRDRVLIYRRQNNQMVKGRVDLDFPIFPGDTIVIEDRWF